MQAQPNTANSNKLVFHHSLLFQSGVTLKVVELFFVYKTMQMCLEIAAAESKAGIYMDASYCLTAGNIDLNENFFLRFKGLLDQLLLISWVCIKIAPKVTLLTY